MEEYKDVLGKEKNSCVKQEKKRTCIICNAKAVLEDEEGNNLCQDCANFYQD